MKTVLITGAAGNVGSQLRSEFAGRYKLRLSDKRLLRPSDVLTISEGTDTIVHLGGYASEGPWEMILQANIIGCYNVFEAARRNGAKRVVFASSNHALGFYRCDQKIDHRVYPKPDSRYGVSKVFNEALASLYADRYGMEMFCMRIGNVNHAPLDRRRLAIWISGRDMAQLVTLGIEQPDLRFEIVYGISDNARVWFDNSNARRLGYRPQDRSETHAEGILKREGPPGTSPADIYQGGGHCMSEGGTRSQLAGAPHAAPKTKRIVSESKKAAPKTPRHSTRKRR